jgi:hypothetical protein
MPVKKTAKRSTSGRKRKASVSATRKTAAKAAKRVGAAAKKVRKSTSKAIAGATKRANVHKAATRARGVGDSVVAAGEIIRETADLVDSIAQRKKTRPKR